SSCATPNTEREYAGLLSWGKFVTCHSSRAGELADSHGRDDGKLQTCPTTRPPAWDASGVQRPRLAPGARQQLVRRLVAEAVFLRIPLQLLAGHQRDHAEVADHHRPAADHRVADRRLAALDAIDEVLHLIRRPRR